VILLLCLFAAATSAAPVSAAPDSHQREASPPGESWIVLDAGWQPLVPVRAPHLPQKVFTADGWNFAIFGREQPAKTLLSAVLPQTRTFWASEPIIDFSRYALGVVWKPAPRACFCFWQVVDLLRDDGAAVLAVQRVFVPPTQCDSCPARDLLEYRLLLIDRTWLGSVPRTVVVNEAPALFGPFPPYQPQPVP
jgi:hypothetical protein